MDFGFEQVLFRERKKKILPSGKKSPFGSDAIIIACLINAMDNCISES